MVAIAFAERRLVPEPVIRAGIRLFLRDRLAQEARRYSDHEAGLRRFVERMAAEADERIIRALAAAQRAPVRMELPT
jgi:hypothetical protein